MNHETENEDSAGLVLATIVVIACLSGLTGFFMGLLVGVLRHA